MSLPRRLIYSILLLAALSLTATRAHAALLPGGGMQPQKLRCEYLENPLGIDEAKPRLSWILASTQRGACQSAYQILVAGSEGALQAGTGDLWDSGKVESGETAQVEYAGKPLASGQRAWWTVRVWDGAGQASPYSKPGWWEMGLLSPGEWHGKWIARTTDTAAPATPLLRRAFTLPAKVRQARVYICGLGYYELSINGRRVGDHILDPGYTRYDRRALYVTYDVTKALRRGDNAVGVMLGNGWLNVQEQAAWDFAMAPWRATPRLLLELRAELEDGKTVTLTSDGQWKTSDSPITFSCIYGGETYDARLEQPGWDAPGFDDAKWQAAKVVEAPAGKLTAQMHQPIKVDRAIKPAKVTEPKPGVFVFDAGQNLAGFAELSLAGPAGTKVVMKYSEHLAKDGTADQGNIGVHVWKKGKDQPFQTDSYILKGEGTERWHARFDYHGFQYVEVTGAPGKLTAANLKINFAHSAVPEAGRFACANPLLNKIWENARWSYLNNLYGIPTDCPHREKNGWTGDASLACEQGLLTYDGAAVYTKWINDLGDEQKPSGELPGICPTGGWGYAWGNGPAWDSAYLLIPYYLYEYCGDTRLLERQYAGHKRYVDYLTTKAKDGIVSIGLGDWCPWKTKTPAPLTSTGYYYRDALIVAQTAKMLGKTEAAEKYAKLAESIKAGFNKKFFKAESGTYDEGSQTALSCALYQGLVRPEDEARVVENLVAAVRKTDDHIDTGILGAKYLLNTLTDHGQADVAYRIVAQETQPGWGWWVRQGATTLWEEWNGSASQNHIMFGDVSAWMTKTLAGINPDPAAPGFKHVIIRPNPVAGLAWARASYDSIRGRIASEWSSKPGVFELKVVIPAGATATVWLPGEDAEKIREGGRALAGVKDVKVGAKKKGRIALEIGSGQYLFSVPR